jgi:hypothetical protein
MMLDAEFLWNRQSGLGIRPGDSYRIKVRKTTPTAMKSRICHPVKLV